MGDRPDIVTIYEAADGFRWHRKSPNGEIVSESGEAYVSLVYARKAAQRNGTGVGYVFDSKPYMAPVKKARVRRKKPEPGQ